MRDGILSRGSARRPRGARLRRRPHRPELRARHHVGPGGPRPARPRPRARPLPAGPRHDGLGHGRPGGRGDAARRARLRAEALGQHAAAHDAAHADRARPRAAARGPPRGREPNPAQRGGAGDDRGIAGHAPGPGRHRARGARGCQRAHHRRERQRQGRRRAGAARRLVALGPAVRDAQLRRDLGRRLRERAVRPRARRLHRRPGRPRRPLRARARAERSSSTRSATCRRRSRASCCA